jgi:mannose-6-phosphate isomerase-like protein (cupin superfamily)
MKCDRSNAEHYQWGDGCEGWRLVDLPELSVIEERMPPGASEKLHYHEHARQYFHILSGEALFTVGEEHVPVQAGEGIHIAPGSKHCVQNAGTQDLRFVLTSAPSTRGDRHDLEH